MQGTWVQSLVQEDPTCREATKPHAQQLLTPHVPETELCNKRSHQQGEAGHRNQEQPLLTATRESLHAATKFQHN